MRHIILFLLSFLIAITASAKCTNSGIYCLNKSPTLNKNGLIILEFYASSQSLVPELNKKYPIFMKSHSNKVQLNIIEMLKGEMGLTQVVLKPGSDLIENEMYSVEIDSLPNYEGILGRYNNSTNKWEQLTFKINNSIDNAAPILNNSPAVQKKTLVYYGCGPASWVYFNITGEDQSELFVRTSVKNIKTGDVTTYILSIENDLVKVGHEMCSGAFLFENDDEYEVVFQLFDQSGNKSTSTNPIPFTKPANRTDDE